MEQIRVIVYDTGYGNTSVLDACTIEAFTDSSLSVLDFLFNHSNRIYNPKTYRDTPGKKLKEMMAIDQETLAKMPAHMAEEITKEVRRWHKENAVYDEQQEVYDRAKDFLDLPIEQQRGVYSTSAGKVFPTAWGLIRQLMEEYQFDGDDLELVYPATSV